MKVASGLETNSNWPTSQRSVKIQFWLVGFLSTACLPSSPVDYAFKLLNGSQCVSYSLLQVSKTALASFKSTKHIHNSKVQLRIRIFERFCFHYNTLFDLVFILHLV